MPPPSRSRDAGRRGFTWPLTRKSFIALYTGMMFLGRSWATSAFTVRGKAARPQVDSLFRLF
jgi:hypothetical protein